MGRITITDDQIHVHKQQPPSFATQAAPPQHHRGEPSWPRRLLAQACGACDSRIDCCGNPSLRLRLRQADTPSSDEVAPLLCCVHRDCACLSVFWLSRISLPHFIGSHLWSVSASKCCLDISRTVACGVHTTVSELRLSVYAINSIFDFISNNSRDYIAIPKNHRRFQVVVVLSVENTLACFRAFQSG